ncbi:MAG: ComF family protein [Endomicrobium sp.]|nr:ComF family protein [Endomicrobium sp.]
MEFVLTCGENLINDIKNLLLRILAFFYPVTCSCCGKLMSAVSKERVCDGCRNSLDKIKGFICHKCGLPLEDGGEHCYVCRHNPKEFHFDKMRAAYLYKNSVRRLILKFKYFDRIFLAADLAQGVIEVLKQNDFFNDTDIVIPVPLNIVRRIKRGYNQAALLALEVGKSISKPVSEKILLRSKITKPQFKLSKKERTENIKNSFVVKNHNLIKKKNVLLVDDIVTTSATASACAKVLKESGASKVYVIALARD